MNNIFRLAVVLFLSAITVNAQDREIHKNKLPREIQYYLMKHFPNNRILEIETDNDDSLISYEIELQNDIELEFKGTNIKEIDSKTGLPNSVIPRRIRRYVRNNYPNSYITKWEFDDDETQEIELNNELELEFDKRGRFIKIDDD